MTCREWNAKEYPSIIRSQAITLIAVVAPDDVSFATSKTHKDELLRKLGDTAAWYCAWTGRYRTDIFGPFTAEYVRDADSVLT